MVLSCGASSNVGCDMESRPLVWLPSMRTVLHAPKLGIYLELTLVSIHGNRPLNG